MNVSLNDLKREKERLISRYMQLQDVIDQYNNEIYKLCCQIEALNILIEGEEKKKAGKNGNGHTAPVQPEKPRHPEAQ